MQSVSETTAPHGDMASQLAPSSYTSLFASSNIADAYIRYRPMYGDEVFDAIVAFCREAPTTPSASNTTSTNSSSSSPSPMALALDLGCGSGQSTLPLARSFRSVVGVDASPEQVAQAPRHLPNVTFRAGEAEDLSFAASGSVDLVTVSQALHWLDKPRLYAEVARVLRPGGAFVAVGYVLRALPRPQAQDAVEKFLAVLRPYFSPAIADLEDHYRPYHLPFPGWRRNDDFVMEKKWTVDELAGFLSSWSPYHQYLRANPSSNLLAELKQKLQAALIDDTDRDDEQTTMTVSWSVFMLMGHKPLESKLTAA